MCVCMYVCMLVCIYPPPIELTFGHKKPHESRRRPSQSVSQSVWGSPLPSSFWRHDFLNSFRVSSPSNRGASIIGSSRRRNKEEGSKKEEGRKEERRKKEERGGARYVKAREVLVFIQISIRRFPSLSDSSYLFWNHPSCPLISPWLYRFSLASYVFFAHLITSSLAY